MPKNKSITVPVEFDGFVVGRGVLTNDGNTLTITFKPDGVGVEMREVLLYGMANSVSIRPNYTPAYKQKHQTWLARVLPFGM